MRQHATIPLALLLIAGSLLVACDDDHYHVGPPPVAVMDWILYDGCADGLGLQAALFDVTHGRVWPSARGAYYAGPGGAIDARITCDVGALICYGAETDPPTDIFWGVGLDGQEPCADCCEPCDDVLVELELVCGPRLLGTGKAISAKTKTGTG